MKRHRSLIPLSRDHHDGLVLAQRLILGRAKAPRSGWPTDRREQVSRVIEFFNSELRRHFEAEEMHVFPAAVEHLREGADLARQLIDEHDDMRARIRGFEKDPTANLEERLSSFGECLKEHIRREEGILFERMQEEVDPAELDVIGIRLRTCYPSDPDGSYCRTDP